MTPMTGEGPLPSLERRLVMLRGTLDDRAAGQAAAELMTLDAMGDGPVTMHVDAGGGTLQAAFTLMDTIDLLGVPVNAVCVGRVEGPAVGVVAVAWHRVAGAHTRFRLCEPEARAEGRASELEQWVHHHQGQLAQFTSRLVQVTGWPAEHVEADLAAGRYLSADEAVRYRLIDEVLRPAGGGYPVPGGGRPFGFRPTP
jgi:ATP-dependent Clp protease protease subunit